MFCVSFRPRHRINLHAYGKTSGSKVTRAKQAILDSNIRFPTRGTRIPTCRMTNIIRIIANLGAYQADHTKKFHYPIKEK